MKLDNGQAVKEHRRDCKFCGNTIDQSRSPKNAYYALRYCSKTCRVNYNTKKSLEEKSKRLRAERGL